MDSDSSSDCDSDDDCGQKLPPLPKAINHLLRRYPDGQIFKVINALFHTACDV